MKLYVGTYAKYNNGSIAGAWLDLDKFSGPDEFEAACRKLHRDERDPEFMFQDCELVEGRDWECGLYSEGSFPRDYWELKKQAEMEERVERKPKKNDPVRAAYRKELEKEWSDTRMVDYCEKKASVIVELSDGFLLPIEKCGIETRHCEGEDDGRGRSMAEAEAGCRYFETEEGFKKINLDQLRDCDFYFDTETHRRNARIMRRYANSKIVCLVDIERSYCAGEVLPLAMCDIDKIRAGYEEARTAFKKRLDTYWKKYGNTKLHTWTYWTEA